MGLQASRNFAQLKAILKVTILYALTAPLTRALLALLICRSFGLPLGETILLMVLAASGSYIAVPAVLHQALPEVNPGLYMGMSLGVTFPLNIMISIPLYTYIAQRFMA